jgi:hypothetical protein
MPATKTTHPYSVVRGPFDFKVVDVRTGATEASSTSRVRAQATASALNTSQLEPRDERL